MSVAQSVDLSSEGAVSNSMSLAQKNFHMSTIWKVNNFTMGVIGND